MRFFFTKDCRHRYRYFSAKPFEQIQVEFSRWKELWEKAKQKLMLLPRRVLIQEQAFEQVLKTEGDRIEIMYSGTVTEQRIKVRFFFFLQRQRTGHILFLIGEGLLLPISGLAAILPGPNVFFGVLALLMITHWQALRGIIRLTRKETVFIPTPVLENWERAIQNNNEEEMTRALEKMEDEFGLENLPKILRK